MVGQFDATAPSNGPSQAGLVNTDLIAEAHLFGEVDAQDVIEAVPSGPVPDDLPDARVNFHLKGTIAASEDETSVAIIANSSKEEKVYQVGDPIQPGTTLHEIHTDLVVLNQNGTYSKLKLPREFATSQPTVRRPTPTPNRASNRNTQSIQSVVAQNVSKLADVIRPTPYFVAGQQQGYRVYPGRDRKQFAALGLRPGDLIKDIDGAALTDPKQAMEIFQNLGTSDEVSVTVERNGQPQVLVLKTNQLALDQNK